MLDTNIIIYTMKKRPKEVRGKFIQHKEQICISSVTLGELVFGAERSQKVEQNLKDIKSMIARLEVTLFGVNEAYHFGPVRSGLYAIGKPIGPYDMMIAAHARASGLILVTNNCDEFKRVPGLLLENWVNC